MIYSLTWLAPVLEAAGLKVAEVRGWEARGRADMSGVVGVICHHTAGPATGNMPSLDTLINGRSDLPGPLAHLGLGRDGTFYVIAAGRCNHAGVGSWQGVTTGNSSFIGIEAENSGLPGDTPWPKVQIDAYQRGVAAILKHIGTTADFCAGHKEYALPAGRKPDPDFDMVAFRSSVAAILEGSALPPTLIPSAETASKDGQPPRPTLRRGAIGDLVVTIQQACALDPDRSFGPVTEAAVRVLQSSAGLVPDGIVGPKTWALIDRKNG